MLRKWLSASSARMRGCTASSVASVSSASRNFSSTWKSVDPSFASPGNPHATSTLPKCLLQSRGEGLLTRGVSINEVPPTLATRSIRSVNVGHAAAARIKCVPPATFNLRCSANRLISGATAPRSAPSRRARAPISSLAPAMNGERNKALTSRKATPRFCENAIKEMAS